MGEEEKEDENHTAELEEEEIDGVNSGDSFVEDSEGDDNENGEDEERHSEEPLTEQDIEELISELLEVESKAAEAQEALEEESLAKVEADVREELAQSLSGDDLEKAVAEEMRTLKEEWDAVLDELETESSHLLEQLDGAGIELPSLYKWIESQAPNVCYTDAWKKRAHWIGSQLTSNVTEAVADAEKYLQIHRPVRRKHGKILEEGASGFLEKKLAINDGSETTRENSHIDWCTFSKVCSDKSSLDNISFGSKHWASVYLASTPQQAAELGLKFPGVDEVEEIDDIEVNPNDPFIADAIENERDISLSEEQKKNFRKVKEEDDVNIDRRLQLRLKQRRRRSRSRQEDIQKEISLRSGVLNCDENAIRFQDTYTHMHESPSDADVEKKDSGDPSVIAVSGSPDIIESRGSKRSKDQEELDSNNKKCKVNDSTDEAFAEYKSSPICNESEMADHYDIQPTRVDIAPSSPVHSHSESLRCTACDGLANKVHAHPLLNVIVCVDCKNLMEAKMQVKEVNFLEHYCRWCGRNSDLIHCQSCESLFCIVCIRRNLGEEFLSGIKTSGWQCCCCTPSILQRLTFQLEELTKSEPLKDSSSDTDSDDSDVDVNVNISSTKRRRKKKIRRILDDAELGEETKRKIAIEKERQERLKSLGAQFSGKAMLYPAGCKNTSFDGGSVEVLGDSKRGYIVNVVREEGEEPVRIPPSISEKLKSHQIAGIRFMWENIIQSIRKVKSGDKGLGCILAHTMGLGKTFQVIAFLYTALRSVDLGLRTALIVTPLSVLHNWRHEFLKWRPSEVKPLRVFMLEDVSRERRAELLLKWRSKGGVFLIGYSAFRNLSLGKHIKDRYTAWEISHALQDGPDILVCDEAHMIKNTRADVTQALKQVKCQRRIALTGSPLQNNLMEYYCMVNFVREGFLGSSHEFRNRFQNPIENGQHTNSTAEDVKIMNQRSHILYEQLKGFVQRMDMNVVKKDLPPKTVYVVAVKLSSLQRRLYKRFLDVHGFTKDKVCGEKMLKRSFFAGYQALAQIWNHPGILQLMKENRDSAKREDAVENFLADDSSSDENTDYNIIPGEKLSNSYEFPSRKSNNGFIHEGWWGDLLQQSNYKDVDYSGKMVLLLDILMMCSNIGDKALVFSQSLSTLDLIELYLSKLPRPGRKGKCWKKGKDWYRLDGRTESSERQKLVERFNEPLNRRVKCILISTRAGSLGINLHAANRVIIVDGSWNPTYDLQAIYRVWRYGQSKPVFAYRLLAHGTMEEKIYKRQVTKEGLAARVVDRQQVHRTISKEEMLHLFEFGDDENAEISTKLGQEKGDGSGQDITVQDANFLNRPLHNGSLSSDKLMQSLISRHHPRWIANYHEHETLLQENEDERLSKEEQDLAWEVYRRTLEWEEVKRVSPEEPSYDQQRVPGEESIIDGKPPVSNIIPSEFDNGFITNFMRSSRNRLVQRKCTNLSHLLTLRSQGTKVGRSTVCGECAQEISWEILNKGTKPVR